MSVIWIYWYDGLIVINMGHPILEDMMAALSSQFLIIDRCYWHRVPDSIGCGSHFHRNFYWWKWHGPLVMICFDGVIVIPVSTDGQVSLRWVSRYQKLYWTILIPVSADGQVFLIWGSRYENKWCPHCHPSFCWWRCHWLGSNAMIVCDGLIAYPLYADG